MHGLASGNHHKVSRLLTKQQVSKIDKDPQQLPTQIAINSDSPSETTYFQKRTLSATFPFLSHVKVSLEHADNTAS
jgi:hypothetical protein